MFLNFSRIELVYPRMTLQSSEFLPSPTVPRRTVQAQLSSLECHVFGFQELDLFLEPLNMFFLRE